MVPSQYLEWMKELVANAQEKKYEYLIGRMKDKSNFFYFDFEHVSNETLVQLIWTPHQCQAFPFDTEQEVEEFKAEYVTPRKASIIRVIKSPQSMFELIG